MHAKKQSRCDRLTDRLKNQLEDFDNYHHKYLNQAGPKQKKKSKSELHKSLEKRLEEVQAGH